MRVVERRFGPPRSHLPVPALLYSASEGGDYCLYFCRWNSLEQTGLGAVVHYPERGQPVLVLPKRRRGPPGDGIARMILELERERERGILRLIQKGTEDDVRSHESDMEGTSPHFLRGVGLARADLRAGVPKLLGCERHDGWDSDFADVLRERYQVELQWVALLGEEAAGAVRGYNETIQANLAVRFKHDIVRAAKAAALKRRNSRMKPQYLGMLADGEGRRREYLHAARGLRECAKGDAATATALRDILTRAREQPKANQLFAALALWWVAGEADKSLEVLPATLRNDQYIDVRSEAASVLGEMRSPTEEAVSSLIQGMSDPAWQVRASCVRALGSLGPTAVQRASPALRNALDDHSEPVRKAAAEALKKIQAEE